MRVKYKYQKHDNCPRCGMANEKVSHRMQCKGAGVHLIWKDALQKLTQWMTQQCLHPEIRHIIIDHLQSWRTGYHSQYTPSIRC